MTKWLAALPAASAARFGDSGESAYPWPARREALPHPGRHTLGVDHRQDPVAAGPPHQSASSLSVGAGEGTLTVHEGIAVENGFGRSVHFSLSGDLARAIPLTPCSGSILCSRFTLCNRPEPLRQPRGGGGQYVQALLLPQNPGVEHHVLVRGIARPPPALTDGHKSLLAVGGVPVDQGFVNCGLTVPLRLKSGPPRNRPVSDLS